MLSQRWIIIIIGLLISGCTVSKNVVPLEAKIDQIVITCINLSEDAFILSSKEDEILILVFDMVGDGPTNLLVEEQFIFNKDQRSFAVPADTIDWSKRMLIVLVELDSAQPINQITDQVKTNYEVLLQAFRKHDLENIETILNDDDLLGIQILEPKDRSINFNGTWRMDRYEYQINLVAHQ